MAVDHQPHIENARRALRWLDEATTGVEMGRRTVKVSNALRLLLYEPAEEHQGDFMSCECRGCTG